MIPGTNVDLTAINPIVEKSLNARAHASYGVVILTSASNFGGGAGISPTGRYTGFVVSESGTTITAATFWDTTVNTFAPTEDISDFPVTAGQYYPFPSLKTITIIAGAIMLIKGEGK
jgi:hypothetical protein